MTERPYVIVLAGGEGTRLASLTRALYGEDLPKQFAVLSGERSLLQQTVERARVLTTLDRILVVVTGRREEVARDQLAAYPGIELVVQPCNLDTAPGMLLPLVRILARTWTARIVFMPSDHYMSDSTPLLDALRSTEDGSLEDRVTLIGVAPTGPEVEYGWIAAGPRIGHTNASEVARFHEKPEQAVADEIWRRGGLWNTFISCGPVAAFWEAARARLPLHAAALERYATAIGGLDELAELDRAYRTMAPANFSRDVFAHASALAVLPVAATGWSDWGSPKRVFASLAGTPCHDRLVARIRRDVAFAG